MSPLLITVYVATGVASIVIAAVLVYVAKLSIQAREEEKRKLKQYMDSHARGDESLQETLYEKMGEFVDTENQRLEASRKVLEVFDKELEKKTEHTVKELSKKYENVIAEKNKDNKVAWDKYKKVSRDKKTTEAVVRSISEGLVVVDKSGKVVMLNPAAEKLLGVEKKGKIGKSVLGNLKSEQLVSFVKEGTDPEDREIELVSKENETKKVLRASSAVIENENGQTVGMVSVLSDVTKQKELDRLKSNFVSNITHELRTPLVATQKSVTLLLTKSAGSITNAQENFLSVADRNLKRLSILIDDLLDLSKMEAGKLELRREVLSIDRVVDDSIESLDTWAKTKSINIEKKLHAGVPEVNIDADRIIQVLNNLIGNAIKYTPENGNITVEIASGGDNNSVELSVADTGIGIPEENLPHIFDKFYQVGERGMERLV